jgi:homoserine dehydrogenase
MERRINKIDGVISASISFAAQKLFLEVEEGKFEKIVEKAQQVCRKIEPDCRIVY